MAGLLTAGSGAVDSARGAATVDVGTVTSLGVAAVKGTAHAHPDHLVVHRDEVVGDRRWALIQARGAHWRVVRTVECPAVMRVRARPAGDGGLWLDLPDGRGFLIDAPEAQPLVADYWGRSTTVRPVPGPWDDALSALLGRSVRLAAVQRAGGVVYAEPVSLLTSSSLHEMARRGGVEVLDDERFRSTVVVDTPGLPPFTEDGWVDRRVRIGSVELLGRRRLARCGVIRVEPRTGRVAGPDLLRLLAEDRTTPDGIVVGLGAQVLVPGVIVVGDAVTVT